MRGHTRGDCLLGDLCDGSYFKEHPLYSQHPNSLQILLYYDEIEVCNPLGSKVKIHKLGKGLHVFILLIKHLIVLLGCFYYLLGNLSPFLRSQLKSIQLLAIAKSSVVEKYGSDAVLAPFMSDLICLETVRIY